MIVTKETIKEEVEKVPKERLNDLYEVIKDFSQPKKKKSKEEFLANLQKIRIDAPADFAANIDEYLYGGKDFGENLR
jgi:CRISPR/Cas system CSM-associated protein Csm2 small subunit